MTDSNLTLIAALLDRSGSMETIKKDTEGGFNSFIEAQKKVPGAAQVTLAQFDTLYERVYSSISIHDVPKFTLKPRGGTALLDGIGRLVTEIGQELAALEEDKRPGKVIVVIMTDGEENSSHAYNVEKVRKLIKQQQDEWKWEFVFLGSNIDAIAVAGEIGIARGSSITYTDANVPIAMAAVSNYVANTRSGLQMDFSEEERSAAVKK